MTRPGTSKTRTRSNSVRGTRDRDRYVEPSEVTKWDPGLTERVMGLHPTADQGLAPRRGARTGRLPARRRAGGRPTTRADCSRWTCRCSPPTSTRSSATTDPSTRSATTSSSPGRRATSSSKTGFIRANHENADEALRSGGVVIVFPGGDYDVYRPTLSREQDRLRRPHRLRPGRASTPACRSCRRCRSAARRAQLFLTRGEWLAKALRLDKLLRAKILPISFGFPFGLSAVLPVNVPLPTKIVTQVLPADRHRRGVRRGSRRRRGRRPRPARHAAGARRTGQGTPPSGARLTMWRSPTGSAGTSAW